MGLDSAQFRERVFDELRRMLEPTAGFLTREALESFHIDGIRLPLIDNYQAIHNPTTPVELDATLSVYSVPGSRYDDGDSSKGVWRYGYTGRSPGGAIKSCAAPTNFNCRSSTTTGLQTGYTPRCSLST